MPADLCVQPHDIDRQALPSLRLCPSCRDHLECSLAELPSRYDDLGRALATTRQSGPRVSGSSAKPLPINLTVAEHRDQIQHDLVWWSVYVAQTRGIALPHGSDPRVTAAWLTAHAEWIAADRVGAEECLPVLRSLIRRARGLLDPDRYLPTGERCSLEGKDGARCTGLVTMVIRPDHLMRAYCTICGTHEAAPYLHAKVAGRWVTWERVQVYALNQWSVSIQGDTVRQWARRGHITSMTENGTAWYDLGSVRDYLAQRARKSSA